MVDIFHGKHIDCYVDEEDDEYNLCEYALS